MGLIPDLEQVPEIKADIQEGIDDLPSFLRDKVDVSTSGNIVKKIKRSNIAYSWARIGISLGIAF
ncbi:hypothetical protein [Gaoshiqia sediminis]|uniref:Uncharacterized protein n=1 Tax=Gaoshiqia sediminis TaxID=2986998 RepID=A0AA42CB59_9BACT|nr:hypothetical protein [Gaoshiqia sediminis]MCW0484802.1 hypothetical protein [Gaoshiqia sediminis]